MFTFIKIAWRNIARNLRRTFITVSAIGLGLSVLLFQQSFVTGFQDRIVENSIRSHSGHIQIHKEGYFRNKKAEIMIERPFRIIDILNNTRGIKGFTQRVNFRGLASSPENSSGVQVFGIDPIGEKSVTFISEKVIKGEYLLPGEDSSILIGETLVEDLVVDLGEKVVLMTQSLDGSMGAELYRLKGVFSTGNPMFDEGVVYITREAAQKILVMGEGITEVAVLAETMEGVDDLVSIFRNNPALNGFEVLSWKDISPHLVQVIELQGTVLLIVLSIVFAIVALGIINTLLMSVMERIREFGIMMSLGTKPVYIVTMIVAEAFYLGILGLFLGVTVGFSIVFYFSTFGIDLSSFSEAMTNFLPAEAILYPKFSMKYTIISSTAVLFISLIASLYPALKAVRLRPVEALRHV